MAAKGGRKINLGKPDPLAALAAQAGPPGGGGPPPADGGGGPPPPTDGGGGLSQGPDMGAGENVGAADGTPMEYPELHTGDLPPESGIQDLPDEGHAKIHYKVSDRGKHTVKHGPDKGKEKHSATLEVHHIMPESGDGGGGQGGEDSKIRNAASQYFKSVDEKAKKPKPKAPPAPPQTESDAMSEMPG